MKKSNVFNCKFIIAAVAALVTICALYMVLISGIANTQNAGAQNSPDESVNSNENTVTLFKESVQIGAYDTITAASEEYKAQSTATGGAGNYAIKVAYRSEPYAEPALILYQEKGANLTVEGVVDENGNMPTISNKSCTNTNPAYCMALCSYSNFDGGPISISNFSLDISEKPSSATDATGIFCLAKEQRYAHNVTINNCYCKGQDTSKWQFVGSNGGTNPAGIKIKNCHSSNVGYFVNGYFNDRYESGSLKYEALTVEGCVADTECKAFVNLQSGNCTLNVTNCKATINGTYAVRGGKGESEAGSYTNMNITGCEFTMTNTTPKEDGGIIVPRATSYATNVKIDGNCKFSRAESTNDFTLYDIYNNSSAYAQQLNVKSGATVNSDKYGVHSVNIAKNSGFNFGKVAKIGDLNYVHLQDAFNACQPGDTINLLKDKITVADYGSESYGKYTEITASSPTAAEVGTPMPDDALANIVLRRQNAEGVANTLINSYSGGAAPSDYVTIEGLHDDTNDGTQIGSLDFSGADHIKVKYLKFDAENRIKTYNYYSSTGTAITNTKDKAGATTINAFGDGYMCSICDVNYGGSGAPTIDTENSAAIGINISNCTFSGIITEEQFDAGVDYTPITCYDQGISGYRAEDWTVDSCNFTCQSSDCMMVQYFSNARHGGNTITFTNNTCGSSDTVFFCDILSIGTACWGNITVTGNKFYNWSWKEKIYDPDPTGGGCIWLTYKVDTSKTNLTIKNNEFNYTQGQTSDLKYVGTIRLRLNVVPPTGYLTLNGVAWDTSTEETKAAFHDALTSEEAGNIHPGRGIYYDGSESYEGRKEKWMYVSDVSFNTDGGSTAPDTQYIIYNEKATAPADPTKEGYTFKGWYAEEATTAFDFANTKITKPVKLTAKWAGTEFTVKFDSQGGSEIQDQTVKYGQTATKPSPDPTKEGCNFKGWYTEPECTTEYVFTTPVTANKTLYAKWEDKECTVKFDSQGGSEVQDQMVKYGQTASKPSPDPTKEGCNFKGWYTEPEGTTEYDFSTPVKADKTLYAKWQIITFTVRFDTSGGSEVEDQTVQYNKQATKPSPSPTKEGYTFAAWMNGDSVFDFSTPITKDLTLTASWQSSESGEVVVVVPDVPYDPETGEAIVEINETSKQQALDNAESIVASAKAGIDVNGLTKTENKELQETVKDLESSELSITVLEPTVVDLQKTIPETEKEIVANASLPQADLACSYDFSMAMVVKVVDYTTGELKRSFNANLTQIDESVDYKVRLQLPEHVYDDSAIQVLKVHQLNASDITTDCVINRTEKYADVPAYQFSTYLVNVSNSLYLSFDSQGGSEVTKQIVTYNTCATEPTPPTRVGYKFGGWYNEPECLTQFNFNTPVTVQKTLYANWVGAVLTVKFDTAGGSAVADQTVNYGEKASRPSPNPTKNGYVFKGWIDSDTKAEFDFDTPITKDLTLTALWEEQGGGGDVPSSWDEIANVSGSASTTDLMATTIITLVAIAGACAALMLLKRKFAKK